MRRRRARLELELEDVGTNGACRQLAAVLLVALPVAGCGGAAGGLFGPGPEGGAAAPGDAPAAAVAAAAADPVVAFAARAAPGAETSLVLPESGRPVRVRLLRDYAAASGRPCREVIVSSGLGDRSRVLCRDAQLGWVEARPLLRGGGGGGAGVGVLSSSGGSIGGVNGGPRGGTLAASSSGGPRAGGRARGRKAARR